MIGYLSADDGEPYYAVAIETGEVSNLSAEMGLVSFRTGEGISPGRLVRVAHALARGCLLYLHGKPLYWCTRPSLAFRLATSCLVCTLGSASLVHLCILDPADCESVHVGIGEDMPNLRVRHAPHRMHLPMLGRIRP